MHKKDCGKKVTFVFGPFINDITPVWPFSDSFNIWGKGDPIHIPFNLGRQPMRQPIEKAKLELILKFSRPERSLAKVWPK